MRSSRLTKTRILDFVPCLVITEHTTRNAAGRLRHTKRACKRLKTVGSMWIMCSPSSIYSFGEVCRKRVVERRHVTAILADSDWGSQTLTSGTPSSASSYTETFGPPGWLLALRRRSIRPAHGYIILSSSFMLFRKLSPSSSVIFGPSIHKPDNSSRLKG